jgi:hypothetical protein
MHRTGTRHRALVSERQSSMAGFSAAGADVSQNFESQFKRGPRAPQAGSEQIHSTGGCRSHSLSHTHSYTRIFEIPIAICLKACNFFSARVRRAWDVCVCNLSRGNRKLIWRAKPPKRGDTPRCHSLLPLPREPVEAVPKQGATLFQRCARIPLPECAQRSSEHAAEFLRASESVAPFSGAFRAY